MLGKIILLLAAVLACCAITARSNTDDVVVDNLEELRALFYEHQDAWIPLALPGEAILFQDFGLVVPFNANGDFPKRFIRRLPGEYSKHGIVTYQITLIEDSYTRQLVVCDTATMTELWRMDADPLHDPYAYLRWSYGLSAVDSLAGIHKTEIQRMDSAKVAADFLLVEETYYGDYVIAEDQARQAEAAMPMAMSAPPLPGGASMNVTGGAGMVTNGGDVAVTFSLPLEFGGYAEIFKTTNLKYVPWSVAENRLSVIGGTELAWTDVGSSNQPCGFYILSDADLSNGTDTDGDGYTDLREIYITKTDANEYNFSDHDNDNLHDWYEVMLFGGNITNQSAADDFDGDGLLNGQEMNLFSNEVVFIADPTNPDTDGDGTDDGTEVAQGGNPADGSDGGEPPPDPPEPIPVQAVFCMTNHYSDHLATYWVEISGPGISESLNCPRGTPLQVPLALIKGESYSIEIKHDGYNVPGGYAASITGTNLVVDNAGGALGDRIGETHDGDIWTAEVHVPLVQLSLSQTNMTLKYDNLCELSVITKPDALQFSDHQFEIKFQDEFEHSFRGLGAGTSMNWKTGVAGTFSLRAKATAGGEETVISQRIQAEVQFPNVYEIKYDSGIESAMEAAWQQTLIDSTPTSYRENGFLIWLDTRTDKYTADSSVYTATTGTPGTQVTGEYWFNWENTEEIRPTSSGANYPVALFHTHPPFTFANPIQYPKRDTGPSDGNDEDVDMAEEFGLPGLVYDYEDPVIYAGHAETNVYKCYEYGPLRRTKE